MGASAAGLFGPSFVALHSWQAAFWAGGALLLLLVPLLYLYLPESTRFLLNRDPQDPRIGRTLARIEPALAVPQGTRFTTTERKTAGLPLELNPIWHDLTAGFRLIWQNPLIRCSLLALVLRVLSAGVNSVVVIFFIAETLGRPTADLAWLGTANGAAQVLTGSLVVAAAHRAALPVTLLGSMGTMVLGATAMALAPQFGVLVAGVILTSLGNAPANIAQAALDLPSRRSPC